MRGILFMTMKISQKTQEIASMFPLKLMLRLSILLFVIITVFSAVLVSFPVSLKAETPSVDPGQNRTLAFLMKKNDDLYHHIILKAALHHEMDPALVKAIIMAESGYNPKAVSRNGARGLMQLMPGTAKSLGVENIFDPEHNINGGVRYFKRLVNRFNGDLRLALAAYNAGTRKVLNYKGVPPFRATRLYIQKVFIYYEYFKDKMTGDM
jgi:soluble lytic murein transglycosylase-like protein